MRKSLNWIIALACLVAGVWSCGTRQHGQQENWYTNPICEGMDNDIFYQYLQTGQYNPRPSVATIANAMDVGDPSNFARVLDLYGGSHAAIAAEISGTTYTDEQIRESVKACWQQTGYLLDPHGACGYRALEEGLQPGETGVFLETAHPAKFLQTVESIIGTEVEIPAKLRAFMKGEKKSLPMTKEFADFKSYLLGK